MRKPQSQPALAPLTEADREQLANWLRHEDYHLVLDRVCKPRPEGFGLDISIKPLQTFYARVALFDLINARLPADKKLTLAQFESLSSTTFNLDSSTVNGLAAAHQSILAATHNLATSGDNTPAQLLALQRLADFPARAELRAQRAELQQKMRDRKIEMNLHRKYISTEKLALKKRRLALAEQHPKKGQPNQQPEPRSDVSPISTPSPLGVPPSGGLPIQNAHCSITHAPCDPSPTLPSTLNFEPRPSSFPV